MEPVAVTSRLIFSYHFFTLLPVAFKPFKLELRSRAVYGGTFVEFFVNSFTKYPRL